MTVKESMEQVEEVLESAPIAEVIELKRSYGKIAALVAGGIAVGSVVTWFVAKKKLDAEYEARLDKELQESLEFLVDRMNIPNVVVSNDDAEFDGSDFPDDLIAESGIEDSDFEELDEVPGERVVETKPPLEDLVKRNQAVQYNKISTPDEFPTDVEEVPEEEAWNDPNVSVISRDIFMENGTEWEQVTLTYFSDGGVLDISGDFVEGHIDLIGANKPPFGQMSDDANVVYLRNKKLQKEYEVISDPGNATEFLMHSLEDMYKPSRRQ